MPLTKLGYEKRSPTTIKEEMKNMLAEQGTAFFDAPADVQNMMLDTAIVPLLQFENLVADMVNCYGLDYANDAVWLNIANTLGLVKKQASRSSVDLKFTGTPGTFIPANTKVGNFKTEKSITLNSTGVGVVTAFSDEVVDIAPAHTLTEITTIVAEGLQVTNPEASIPANEEETIESLRTRARAILRSSRKGSYDYALARLAAIEGVQSNRIRFKPVDFSYETRKDGQTFIQLVRGVEAVVGGGEVSEIATALFESFLETAKLLSQPSNNETDRSVTFAIKYFGSDIPIVFTRPKLLDMELKLILIFKNLTISGDSLDGMIRDSITSFMNDRDLGLPLNKNALDAFIYNKLTAGNIDITNLVRLDYEIKLNNEKAEFSSNGYLEELKDDCYLNLSGFGIEIGSL